jgi:hypothetical protein
MPVFQQKSTHTIASCEGRRCELVGQLYSNRTERHVLGCVSSAGAVDDCISFPLGAELHSSFNLRSSKQMRNSWWRLLAHLEGHLPCTNHFWRTAAIMRKKHLLLRSPLCSSCSHSSIFLLRQLPL